jgi:HEAT repeat protein
LALIPTPNSKTEGREKMDKGAMVIEKRNIFVFLCIALTFIFAAFLPTSCQKSEERETKKEVQIKKDEIKQPQTIEPKSVDQLEEQAQKPISQELKEEKREIPLAKEPSPLTEEEQKEFEKFGGNWETPSVFKNEKEAIKYLKILLKGNEKTIRWYQQLGMAGKNKEEAEKWRKWKYSDNIAIALDAINTETNKEGFKLAVEVLKTKRDYPEALAKAALVIKFAHDPSVMAILKEIANYPAPSVRLQVAGSLLSLGDADTALPVLDELVEKEGSVGAIYYLFSGPGKMIDERGYKIIEKALNNPKSEVRISAVKLLWESKKITKAKAEEIALVLLDKLKEKTEKDYGIGREKIPGKTYSRTYVLPTYEGKELRELEKPYHSDGRACDGAMWILGEVRSQKAVPFLNTIKETHRDVGWVCWENAADKRAEKALEKIIGSGGGK